jgi:hypothetical protein
LGFSRRAHKKGTMSPPAVAWFLRTLLVSPATNSLGKHVLFASNSLASSGSYTVPN